ncbi:MAG TPA: hypothetical protein VHM65_03965 [Candidatus Lustribacter sp.]|nr:hypothetical protein [Candidatus Lustribacter sp.]
MARRPPLTAERPLVLSGPPQRVQGTFTVENTGSSRLGGRGAVLMRDGHPGVTGQASALIPPGATEQVDLTIPMDPLTEPGEYAAQLDVGGVLRPVVVVVEPALAMRVSPSKVLAGPGRTSLELLVRNDGNVAIPLARTTRSWTLPSGTGDADHGPEVTLRLGTDGLVLEPGDVVRVMATLEVPEDLDREHRHESRLPLGLADLTVLVLPRDGAPVSTPTTRSTGRARRPRTTSTKETP